MSQDKNKPVATLRMGALKASIWRNEDTKGNVWFSTTFTRSYKDGDEWKETQSYGLDDLLPLSKLADQAHTKIFALRAAEKNGGAS